jgi:exodeoxyribonuclease V alpha subunit
VAFVAKTKDNSFNIFLKLEASRLSLLQVDNQFVMTVFNDIHRVFARNLDNDRHIRAAAYAVSKKLEDGHICIDPATYSLELKKEAESPYEHHNPFLHEDEALDTETLVKSQFVSQDAKVLSPLVLSHGKLYLQRYYQYETEIIDGIKRLIEVPGLFDIHALRAQKPLIDTLFNDQQSEDGPDWQLVATLRTMMTGFMIITGGPGTGKTTTVAKLLALFFATNPGARIALAAPTGKAASRMNESLTSSRKKLTGLSKEIHEAFDMINASTIHRLLGSRMNSPVFKYNRDNPLDYDMVIIDEASMVDAVLMAKLISAIPSGCRLIFLGDKDQLASVEAGSIFGDLCMTRQMQINFLSKENIGFINELIEYDKSKIPQTNQLITPKNLLSENIIELTTSYRFSQEEGIGMFSRAILSGNQDQIALATVEDETGLSMIEPVASLENNRAFLEEIDHFISYIEEKDTLQALKKVNDFRVLCALNRGRFGVSFLNEFIQDYLVQKGYLNTAPDFYHNQPVLVTRNDYTQGLFNGDVGLIRRDEEGQLRAFFESVDEEGNATLRSFIPAYLPEFKTAFAMTIHKSQGSEFKRTAIVLPNEEHLPILTRELLYTAVTRAKEHATIIGKEKVIRAAAGRRVSRASGIRERILTIGHEH